mmetsp:Transcript_945/g.2705  ORF Transcript_945/g.2705 Transcript_945/m.2705 type:complete len:216 (-) Transcript_945:108-755(-)
MTCARRHCCPRRRPRPPRQVSCALCELCIAVSSPTVAGPPRWRCRPRASLCRRTYSALARWRRRKPLDARRSLCAAATAEYDMHALSPCGLRWTSRWAKSRAARRRCPHGSRSRRSRRCALGRRPALSATLCLRTACARLRRCREARWLSRLAGQAVMILSARMRGCTRAPAAAPWCCKARACWLASRWATCLTSAGGTMRAPAGQPGPAYLRRW